MDLELSDEQRMLADAARAFVSRRDAGTDTWRQMVALGWTALPTATDLVVVCEALGWGALPSPLITSSIAACAISWASSAQQQDRWLRPLAAGDMVGTFAVLEAGMADEWDEPSIGGGGALTGTKLLVPWAATADVMLVAAVDGLFVVEPHAGGVRCEAHHGTDAEPLFAVELQDAPAHRLGEADHGAILRRALDWAATARLADAVGAAARALDLTLQHAKDREQFGRPIGSFQAVAHRCVDMRTDLDAARYLMYQAAWALDSKESADLEVATAKAYGNEALRRIFGHAHQVHGAVGFSTEHELHRFTRRAKAFELSYGSTDHHLDRVANAVGLG